MKKPRFADRLRWKRLFCAVIPCLFLSLFDCRGGGGTHLGDVSLSGCERLKVADTGVVLVSRIKKERERLKMKVTIYGELEGRHRRKLAGIG